MNQQEPTFEESIKQVMQTLPPPIRQYLSQGKYSIVAKNLMRKYGLHIDQGGILEREIMLLLMGIENPDEFATSLKSEAALSEDVVKNIMADVNQEIFIPLQKEMRNAGSAVQETRSAVPPSFPSEVPKREAPRTTLSTPRYAPSATSRPPISSNSAPLPPKMAMPQPKSVPAVAPPPLSMLPLGEEQKERISNIAPRSSAPPPANLPGAFPQGVAPSIKRPAPPPPFRPVVPAKPYSTDPYREPVDEPPTE